MKYLLQKTYIAAVKVLLNLNSGESHVNDQFRNSPAHRELWKGLGINGFKKLYDSLVATLDKVLSLLHVFCTNESQEGM